MLILALLARAVPPPPLPPPPPLYEDRDRDGASAQSDCDDLDPAVFPGAPERCDGVDNDCDGLVDEDSDDVVGVFYADVDGDGYGAGAPVELPVCSARADHVATAGDCDETSADVHPGPEPDVCDRVDSDCDGLVDEDEAVIFWPDRDGDGFAGALAWTCEPDPVSAPHRGDCDDGDPARNPGAF
ncbi:MAG: putative metal-binding motif-containing protein, partial [Myxococcales bacterium]|nr:putative metal-binding motif-containing protein [Myxococcales bacterium]